MKQKSKIKGLSWDKVEKAIAEEVEWLKRTILEGPHKSRANDCHDCIYRRIAILIVSGRIQATEIKSKVSLWGKDKLSTKNKQHGKEWHSEIMNLVYNYFKSQGNKLAVEPNLNKGRADLGVYRKGFRNIFIEVGTISLSKLLFNLESMEGANFLLILDLKHAIEFSILKAGYKYQTI